MINDPVLSDYIVWLEMQGDAVAAGAVKDVARRSPLGQEIELPGWVGERNLYALRPRGRVALISWSVTGLRIQLGAALATGNVAVVSAKAAEDALAGVPGRVTERIIRTADALSYDGLAAVLVDGASENVAAASRLLAERRGAIVPLQSTAPEGGSYILEWLIEEVSTSINTTAAGGNASLMAVA
jgi:RHH-type proline utilization regulon transcriptional repressor/proline dehydrogenase/delta 1-pyrroline-5-carboxylate dehydrogenase